MFTQNPHFTQPATTDEVGAVTLAITQLTIRITAESKIQRIHIHVRNACSGDVSQMLRKVVHVKALEENAHCACPAWSPRLSAHRRIAGRVL